MFVNDNGIYSRRKYIELKHNNTIYGMIYCSIYRGFVCDVFDGNKYRLNSGTCMICMPE